MHVGKISVIHSSFAKWGGAEEYAAAVIKALVGAGLSVDVYTLSLGSGLARLRRVIGAGARWRVLRLRGGVLDSVGFDSIYGLLERYYVFKRLRRLLRGYDVVINTKASELPLGADVCIVHYPVGFVLYNWDRYVVGAGVDPKYYRSLFWRAYIAPFRKAFYRASKGLRDCRVLVANSSWTARLLEELIPGARVVVLHPPIIMRDYVLSSNYARLKDPGLVVTVSRFDPSKRLEAVLSVAARVKRARFVVIGRVDSPSSRHYYRWLIGLRDRLGLGNVFFAPNAPDSLKKGILSRAGIYFHPVIGEHFGISVLEAVLHGAYPIVHRIGGACSDIVEALSYGKCYEELREAAKHIEEVLANGYRPLDEERLQELVAKFSFTAFRERLLRLVEGVLKH